jgi:hypothetical protein
MKMSATLHWRPEDPPESGTLSDELRWKLGRKLCDTDGSIGYPTSVNASLIPYLEGLADAGIKDAEKLIGLIEKYGSIELTWVH